MGVVEVTEECRTAFQAALELIKEKCGISFKNPRQKLSSGVNRIEASIARINEKLKTVSEAERKKLSETAKVTFQELFEFQKLQSTAFACGKLTLEEAQILYRIYGGEAPSPEKWDKLTLAEKVVGTQTAAELLRMRICDIL